MSAAAGRNDPCPCGSGKKFKHCHGHLPASASEDVVANLPLLIQAQQTLASGNHVHAAQLLQQVLLKEPRNADARHFLGMATAFGGNIGEGVKHILASLEAQPNNPLFHNNLAYWLNISGDLNTAIAHLSQAVELKPDYHQARYQLVKLAMARHMSALAKYHLEILLELEPENPELRYRLAETLLRLKEHTAMEREYRALISRAPQNIELHMKLGDGLRATGRDDEARAEYEAVLAIEPGHIGAHYTLALTEERRHRLEESERWLDRGLAFQPEDPALHLGMARVRRRQERTDDALAHLRVAESSPAPGQYGPQIFYEKGLILDNLKRYDEAFAAFDHANVLDRERFTGTRSGSAYDQKKNKAWFDTLKTFFTRARLAELLPYLPPAQNPQPLFIVGFPRSGTTLTEQMLSRHPNIHAGDELSGLLLIEEYAAAQIIMNRRPFPACLAAATQPGKHGALAELRDFYMRIAAESQAIDTTKAFFTDKMPLNENHLGLIRLLFPESPIIHVVRHPLDIILSCYTNQLYHGNGCALALDTLAFHLVQTWELTGHYTSELDLRYTRMRYEDLLANPEGELRRLLEFIGEPWDPRCLDFHESGRVARTASYDQVSQPLYRTSRERWRHYRKHLEPVIPTMAPLIEMLGYDVT